MLQNTPQTLGRRPRLTLIALAVIVLISLGVVITDQWRRDWEATQIESAAAAAFTTLDVAHNRVRGTVAYASPLLQIGPPEVRATLEALVLAETDSGQAAVDQARQALLDITVWPWHEDVIEQRTRVIAQLDEQASSLLPRPSDPRAG